MYKDIDPRGIGGVNKCNKNVYEIKKLQNISLEIGILLWNLKL